MRNVGFIASSIGHIVLLGWGLFSLPSAEPHDVTELEILPVELVSVSDVTDVRKGEAKAKPTEKVQEKAKKAPEPKKPEPEPEPKPAPKAEPKPKEPTPVKMPEPAPPVPEPAPKPEPPKEPEVQPEPKPEPPKEQPKEPEVEEAKPDVPKPIAALPKVRPRPPKKTPPKKKKRSFDTDALKALANKAEQSAPTQAANRDQDASFGSRTGNQAAAMTQSELDALRAQISPCWSPPVGAADASQLRVKIEFGLDRQGNVISGPEPFEFPANQFGLAAVESAMRAVRRCGPYSNLPQEKYDAWKRVRITFDPREMF